VAVVEMALRDLQMAQAAQAVEAHGVMRELLI